jgi:hypothetical protein
VEHVDDARWRKSSYSSGNGGDCVEVGQATGMIAVRDTKDYGEGQVHRFSTAGWRVFVARLKAGR